MITKLHPSQAALLVIDIQEKLASVMPDGPMETAIKNTRILLEAAKLMGIPVVVSEQYPKGLGPLVPGIAEAIAGHSDISRLEKVDFSVCQAPAFTPILEAFAGRSQWIVTGMESHICVYQTARDLLAGGRQVFMPVDAVVSRAKHNYDIGLSLSRECGATITSTETVVMDLLGRAQGEAFKAISRLIR